MSVDSHCRVLVTATHGLEAQLSDRFHARVVVHTYTIDDAILHTIAVKLAFYIPRDLPRGISLHSAHIGHRFYQPEEDGLKGATQLRLLELQMVEISSHIWGCTLWQWRWLWRVQNEYSETAGAGRAQRREKLAAAGSGDDYRRQRLVSIVWELTSDHLVKFARQSRSQRPSPTRPYRQVRLSSADPSRRLEGRNGHE